jgi:hypothetical protein
MEVGDTAKARGCDGDDVGDDEHGMNKAIPMILAGECKDRERAAFKRANPQEAFANDVSNRCSFAHQLTVALRLQRDASRTGDDRRSAARTARRPIRTLRAEESARADDRDRGGIGDGARRGR